jgi:hypothetical protein
MNLLNGRYPMNTHHQRTAHARPTLEICRPQKAGGKHEDELSHEKGGVRESREAAPWALIFRCCGDVAPHAVCLRCPLSAYFLVLQNTYFQQTRRIFFALQPFPPRNISPRILHPLFQELGSIESVGFLCHPLFRAFSMCR